MDTSDIIKELAETTILSKKNEEQINELHNEVSEIKRENKAIHDIATSVKLIAQDMSYVKEDMAEVKNSQSQIRNELSEVKNSPIKSKAAWVDKAIGAALGIVGTAVFMYILSAIAPNIFG